MPRGYWNDETNKREALAQIGKALGVSQVRNNKHFQAKCIVKLADWYGITRKQVEDNGGRTLFLQHTSLEDALRSCFPDFDWQTSRFQEEGSTPRGYWNDDKAKRRLLDKIGRQLGVKTVCWIIHFKITSPTFTVDRLVLNS